MRFLPVLALLSVAAAVGALAHERSQKVGDPSFFVLTRGIVGGIIAPHASEIILIRELTSEDGAATYWIWRMRQDTRGGAKSCFKGSLPKSEFDALVAN